MKRIIANWKCLGGRKELAHLHQNVVMAIPQPRNSLVVLLPAPLLGLWQQYDWPSWVQLGAQCVYPEAGAYTGAFHPGLLKEVGVTHVCIGHSERRSIFQEDDQAVLAQYLACVQAGLVPILCFGEPKGSAEGAKDRMQVLKAQLAAIFSNDGFKSMGNHDTILAYEPGWAIGSGKAAQPQDVAETLTQLKSWLATNKSPSQVGPSWCYGGSVGKGNMEGFLQTAAIDGLLVGRASFDEAVMREMLT